MVNKNFTNLAGVNPHLALTHIKKRAEERKKGGNSSGLKTALVLQGGAMRGVFGAGVCCALEELGYTEGFDFVFGVSAGALNGAYFLSGQAAYGTTIYYQDINNLSFINFFRLKKKIDIDFLIKIMTKVKPLNVKRLKNSSTTLNVVLTNVSTGEAVVLDTRREDADIIKILKATASIPLVYDIPVVIDGTYFLDGGVSCPIPVTEAIDAGCTDLLVVLTRPKNYRPLSCKRGIFSRILIEPKIKRYGKKFYNTYLRRHKIYAEKLNIILGKKRYGKRKVNILPLFPSSSLNLKRITKKESTLKKAAIEGAIKTFQLFGVDYYRPAEVLKFLNY